MIRHGESIMNAEHLRQGREGALSELGRQQAEKTGVRLAHIKFDAALVSPFERTKETADIICKQIKKIRKPIEYVELLAERRNPSEIIGKSSDTPEVKKVIDIIDKSFHTDDFRYSDEENFTDLRDRANELLKYLSGREEHVVLIETHSIFLKMIAAVILEGSNLTAKKYNLMSFLNTSSNASVTVCECQDNFSFKGLFGWIFPRLKTTWRMIAWDDFTRADIQV